MDETCHVDPIQKTPTLEEREAIQTALLAVRGMGCPNCATRVRNSLIALHGVSEARVNHTAGTAEIEFNPNLTNITALVAAVTKAGGDGQHAYTAWAWESQAPLAV